MEKKKPSLQSICKYQLMTVEEGLTHLGWTYEKNKFGNCENISCPCGGSLEFSGIVGTDRVECLGCHKVLRDALGFHMLGNSYGGIISENDYYLDEEGRHWMAVLPNDKE